MKFLKDLFVKILWGFFSILGYILICFLKNKRDERITKEIKKLEEEKKKIKEEIKDIDEIIEKSNKKDKKTEDKVNSWLEKLNQYKNSLVILIFFTCLLFCNNIQAITPEQLLKEAEIIILEQQEQIKEKNDIIVSLQEKNMKLMSLLNSYEKLITELNKQQQKQHGIALGTGLTSSFQPKLETKYIYKKKWYGFYIGLSKGKEYELCTGFVFWIK